MIIEKKLSEFRVGNKFAYTRTLGEGDCALFVSASGDFNPYHIDEEFAKKHQFGRRIVPGLLTASLFTHIGGELGFLAVKMRLEFLGAVYIGDTITATCELVEIDEKRSFVRISGKCTNQKGEAVLKGEFEGYPTLDRSLE